MKDFRLTNLRELTTEEQMRLNGGANSGHCNASCSCTCYCKCTSDDPKTPIDNSSYDTGKVYTKAAKEREAMQNW